MEHQLLNAPCIRDVSAKSKTHKRLTQTSVCVVMMTPSGRFPYPVFFEIDSDGQSVYRDEIDPDDLTDFGYRHRNKPKKTWSPPGYGDDD